ncbi:conjugative transfer signal peptidase TraF [Allorhizobium pseudoryzae]|uniref:conjugative transfer signal peptidase TraF n=1 Tax=Allorhizobium pseudoryzae TaxID=379684 RepID=UPI003CFC6A56
MKESRKTVTPVWCGRRRALVLLWAVVATMLAGMIGLGAAGFRINLTPSEALGVWRILPLNRKVEIDDLVFVCVPVTDAMRAALKRGYLRRGLCAGGFAPLIKTVVARSGQHIEIEDLVRIDGRVLLHSRLQPRDARGRQLMPFAGGTIPPETVYLHSDFPASFDSRYFGPVPANNILGLAKKVWTYAP